jgi:Arc/MetJ family transcription regulator
MTDTTIEGIDEELLAIVRNRAGARTDREAVERALLLYRHIENAEEFLHEIEAEV